jgi:hypothetical protein
MKEPFDLEEVYDEEIFPLMAKIIEVCKRHEMPFVASFQYATGGDEEYGHCSSALLPCSRPIAPELEAAYAAIAPKKSRGLNITTRDAKGQIVSMETIIS